MRVYNPSFEINTLQSVLWQYNNAEKLQALLKAKQAWYSANHEQFWQEWYDNVFNLFTANDFGLSVWGKILDFKRQISLNDGSVYTLSTEQYRLLLKGRFLMFRKHGTVNQINAYLKLLFGAQGRAYVLDNHNMTTAYVFEFQPTEEQQFLFDNVDFLPRPAGVGYEIRILPNIFLGFEGSDMETFNNGIFYQD